jgi:hypothetical protein
MTEPDEAQKWLEDQADRDWLEDDDYEPSARPETVSELDDNARTFAELAIKCGGTVALLERAREEAIDVAEHAYKIGYRAGQAASAERIKALEEAIHEAMRRLNEYADMTVDEWDDSVADGGIMAWMVIRQELKTVVVYRLDRALLKEADQ